MRKKEFSSFDLAAVVRELKQTIQGSRVNNVYQINAKTLLLKLHKTDQPALRLVLEAGRRLNLTAYAMEKPLTPPAFCMALRKHLRNAWLTNVEQYEFERVATFSFKTKTGLVKLVLELFGDGNVILVGEDARILQALTYKRMKDRNVIREEPFQFAPSIGKNPFKVTQKELSEGLRSFGSLEVVRGITRFLSVGGIYAEEALLKAKVDKSKPCAALDDGEIEAVFMGLQDLLAKMNGVLEPSTVLDDSGSLVDVIPFKLQRYASERFRLQSYNSFSEALDEFYLRVDAESTLGSAKVDGLTREAERLKRIVSDQERISAEAEASMFKEKSIGDTIYAHSSELQALIEKLSKAKQEGRDWNDIVSEILIEKQSNVSPSVLFEALDGRNLIVSVCADGLEFSLVLRKSLFENAAGFYERSKRAKQRMIGAKAALEETRGKMADIEARISQAQTRAIVEPTEFMKELATQKIKHREWYEKFRWFISSDGFLVVAGKDAVTNEVLIKKYAEPEDVVFHADIVGAPFTVVKTDGKQPSSQVLQEASEFAAAFSRGWREGFGSVDVYWVKPEQLSKSAPSGGYVSHGAFAISGKRNWIRNVPLRMAIGVKADDQIEFVGGPPDAVKAKTAALALVAPGDLNIKELFGKIIRVLSEKMPKEQREKLRKASVEEIREFVPYGVGKVLET